MKTIQQALDTLKTYRDNNERKSRDVVKIWEEQVSQNLQNLGKERYVVLEQICIASLDCYRLKIAEQCIKELYKEFPNSCRVRILESMFHEADENYSRALQILNDVVKADPTNSSAKKRKIAICKALGKNGEAIKELTEYLKVYMADVEAWQELSELYITEHDYSKAAFCIEELILHNPHNHLLHQRFADIKYTQGGVDNLEMAKSYYYQAYRLNPKNIRALYGIYLATSALAINPKGYTGKKKDAALKVADWSLNEIKKRYLENEMSEIQESLGALEL